jgi:hypothetical protein
VYDALIGTLVPLGRLAAACQMQDGRHHVGERDGGADLMIGRLSQ